LENSLGKILIIDDNEDVLFAVKMLLKKYTPHVLMEKNPKKIPFLINKENFDITLLDMNFSQDISIGNERFYWLNQILAIDPHVVVIKFSAFGNVEMAVQALKEGATDIVLKPWQNEKLIATLSAAAKLKKSYREVESLKQKNTVLTELNKQPFTFVTGKSAGMKRLFSMIDKVANTDILSLGENSTGKEVIARTVHRQSLRAGKFFTTVDMGAITETVFESELCGPKKGAFTDVQEDHIGRFEMDNGGTCFAGPISLPDAAGVKS